MSMKPERDGVIWRRLMDDGSPFDALAVDYDRKFTHSLIGAKLRQTVWSRLDACFEPGQHIVEFGCGTGADALYLGQRGMKILATDVSKEMVRLSREKVVRAGLTETIDIQRFPMEDLYENRAAFDRKMKHGVPLFDGVLVNFGGLNCLDDLPGFARGLAQCLRPGAMGVFCLMGPLVPWEWVWFLLMGQPAKAFRRFGRNGSTWRTLSVRYPSIRAVIKAFSPSFRASRVTGLGTFLPPSYVESWIGKHPGFFRSLNRLEEICFRRRLLPGLADHYLLELERI